MHVAAHAMTQRPDACHGTCSREKQYVVRKHVSLDKRVANAPTARATLQQSKVAHSLTKAAQHAFVVLNNMTNMTNIANMRHRGHHTGPWRPGTKQIPQRPHLREGPACGPAQHPAHLINTSLQHTHTVLECVAHTTQEPATPELHAQSKQN